MSAPPSELSDITVKEGVLYDASAHHDDYPTFLQADNGVNVGLVDNIQTEDDYDEYNIQPVTGWRTKVPVTYTQPAVSHIAQSTLSLASDYACRQCGKKFYVKLALMVHEQSHISEARNSGSGCPHANMSISAATSVPGSSSQVKSEQNDEHHIPEQGNHCIKVEVWNNNSHEATPVLLESEHFDRHATTAGRACLYCEMRFKRIGLLREHMMIHTGERPHVCDICGESFIRRIDCCIHLKSHGEKPFTCNFCGLRVTKVHLLRTHLLLHEGPVPYLCLMCDVRFPTSESWKLHVEKHNNSDYENIAAGSIAREFKCETCQKIFASANRLKIHHRIHTGERPYGCKFCDRRFTEPGSLRKHHRTHTGERPYVCKFCDKRFGQSAYLNAHLRTHTGLQPYLCLICKGNFSTKADMVSHKGIFHQNKND